MVHTCEPYLEEAEDEEDYLEGGESFEHPDQQVDEIRRGFRYKYGRSIQAASKLRNWR